MDLGEFMAGAAELLRGLLMLQVGAEPEAMTEALRSVLERYRTQLDAGDVLRMLRLLADNEMGIRRSGNPRLVVETLLLRWAMLDRIVDLEQVIQGAGRPTAGTPGQGPSGNQGPAKRPPAASPAAPKPAETRGQAPPALGPIPPSRGAPDRLVPFSGKSPTTLEEIRSDWPEMVAAVRLHSRFLGEALAATEPLAIDSPWLTVRMVEPNQLLAERLQEEAAKIEEVLSLSLGQPTRLRVSVAPAGENAPASKPRRMSESSLKAERLREFRAKDPALDTAADALDLEIVD
jgi:DNA polymerase III subunit gamma/tau